MNTTANNTTSNTIKMMVVLVMMLVSSVGFAQNVIEVPAAVAATTTVESNTSMNMVSWFMGTKQTTNENITKRNLFKKTNDDIRNCSKQIVDQNVFEKSVTIRF